MDVATLIRNARQQAGLSQTELARRAGTSQPTLASYEAGRVVPRIETVVRLLEASDHELCWAARPKVRRGAVPMAAVGQEIRAILRDEGERGAWRRLLDFVDDFRASPRAGQAWLVADTPELCGDTRFDAAMAALVELLCDEAGLPRPGWTSAPERFCEPWWFVSGLPGFEAMAFRDSPIELKQHGGWELGTAVKDAGRRRVGNDGAGCWGRASGRRSRTRGEAMSRRSRACTAT